VTYKIHNSKYSGKAVFLLAECTNCRITQIGRYYKISVHKVSIAVIYRTRDRKVPSSMFLAVALFPVHVVYCLYKKVSVYQHWKSSRLVSGQFDL